MNLIVKRWCELFFRILMVIFIILYFNIIFPSSRSTSLLSPLFKHSVPEITGIHAIPTGRLLALHSADKDEYLIEKFAPALIVRSLEVELPKTPFINLFIILPWCAFATINAP